ncbi:MAG: SUMF1/EgtB/PvdO family nonheme iron enzyme [Xanthobacteraceae bacterium]
MRLLAAFACAVTLICLGVAPGRAEKRVALVIGNSAYQNTPVLSNPKNDATDLSAALRTLGFDVILSTDLDKRGMDEVFGRFARLARDADAALFFYAGHGIQFAGSNYLMPIDAKLQDEADLPYEMAKVDDIIGDLSRAKNIRIIMLDACRDNPMAERLRMSLPSSRSAAVSRGLARIERTQGLITAFATQPGQVAADGVGTRNSPFTAAVLKYIATPDIEATALFRRVAQEVNQSTAGKQLPEVSLSLLGDFYFAGHDSAPAAISPSPPLNEPAQAWAAIQNSTNATVLEEFIKRFSDSFYASLARVRLNELKKSQLAVAAPPVAPVSPCDATPMTVSWSSRPARPLSAGEECALRPKDAFKECDKCPEMAVVPAATFLMGSPPNEAGRASDENPQHSVTFAHPFAVGRFAVTFDEWDTCVVEGGCNGYEPSDQNWGRDTRPVIWVGWDDAKSYVKWLSRKTGKAYRLLSEAEWEYMARAGTTTPFWWGNTISTQQANYNGHYAYGTATKGEFRQKTLPVKSFEPNPWGFYQVVGNVSEWVEDCYHDSYVGAPTDGSAWTSGSCSERVLRDGAWSSVPARQRLAARVELGPNYRTYGSGLRVARTLAP